MNDYKINNQRLIALWAFSESGLGGILHAFKIPLTGFILGAFAIVIMTLLARFNKKNKSATILNATVLVLLIKFIVSPHSPPMAYIAVAFQGLMGIFLFTIIPNVKVASVGIGIITMVESALQKVLITTFIFGMNIWEALDDLLLNIARQFKLNDIINYSLWIVLIYTLIYGIWGCVVGVWSAYFSKNIQQIAPHIIQQLNKDATTKIDFPSKSNKSNKKIFIFLGVLITILIIFLIQGMNQKAIWVLIRTIVAISLLYVLNPLIKWIFYKWFQHQKSKRKEGIQNILEELPILKSKVAPAYQLASKQQRGIKKYFLFVQYFIIYGLYENDINSEKK